MSRFSLIFVLFVFISSCVTTKTAIKDFNNAEYYNAATKFKKVIKEGDSKNSFLLAEALRKSNRLWQAQKYYTDAINNGYKEEIAYYYLAMSLKSNNAYDQADSLISNYLLMGNDENILSLMKNELK